jgi:hypothetical protein
MPLRSMIAATSASVGSLPLSFLKMRSAPKLSIAISSLFESASRARACAVEPRFTI